MVGAALLVVAALVFSVAIAPAVAAAIAALTTPAPIGVQVASPTPTPDEQNDDQVPLGDAAPPPAEPSDTAPRPIHYPDRPADVGAEAGKSGVLPRWPCDRDIAVLVNLDDAPPGALEMAEWAIAQVRDVSGLPLEAPRISDVELEAVPRQTLWIGWKRTDDPVWEGHRVVGLGGVSWVERRGAEPTVTSGRAIIRSGAGLSTIPSDPAGHRLVLLHEVVHAIGVDHVEDDRAVMFSETGATSLNETDRAVIRALGCTGE